MPITKGAKKAVRTTKRKTVYNKRRKDSMKEAVKAVREEVIKNADAKKALSLLPTAYKAIDKAAQGGVIKKNTAARKKSRLSAFVKKSS